MTQTENNNSMLVQATETAVAKRRETLKARRNEIADAYIDSVYIMTYKHLEEMIDIKKELSIIDNLMISTQREYTKLGGKITMEIRHSDEPDKVQNSFTM
jgi:hypothetical protein